jgi:Spy/CpxP family protein refolding chaperone
MRSFASALLAALALAACAGDTTAPRADLPASIAADVATSIATATAASGAVVKALGQLPDSLKLTQDQRAKVAALTSAFEKSTKADRDAIMAARSAAEAAKKASKPDAEVRAILAQAEAAQQRIAAADAALVAAIRALLTPAQDAWVASHLPGPRPEPPKPPVPPTAQPPRAPLPPTVELLRKLPDAQKLSAEQRGKVDAAIAAYAVAVQPDVQAIAAIEARAAEAAKAGKPRAEVEKILAEAAPVRARIAAAQQALVTQLLALLTDAQRAWLAANTPVVCDAAKFPPFTDAQRAQVAALQKAFETANRADLDAIAAARKAAEAARAAKKSEAEVKAILDAVQPAADRVAAARKALDAQVAALLTPEQKATGCPWQVGLKR